MEVSESRHRGALGILSGFPWALGIVGWAGMGYLIRDWRWLNGVAGLLNLLLIPSIWWALAPLVGFCSDTSSMIRGEDVMKIRELYEFKFIIIMVLLSGCYYHWCRLVPESPRWLAVQGRFEEAAEILKKAAKLNNTKLMEDERLYQIMQDIQKVSYTKHCPTGKLFPNEPPHRIFTNLKKANWDSYTREA